VVLRLSLAEREREHGQALGPTSQRVKRCPGTPIYARSWDAGQAPPMQYLLESCLPRKCIMGMGGTLGELLKTALYRTVHITLFRFIGNRLRVYFWD
jgi:hypothetical protein